ncbi:MULTISPECIES: hypothetical protein [Bacillus]|uniref:Uncharacterized protein n=1 Tax=Bacillus anthracis TaxID=1392 RepID=A0A2A7D4G5_BACAN|nr:MULTISPECIES: hypothetical protein [Bacillus]MDC7971741.1 hypothetical protein [Bacillus sp. BLCC-B18]PDZ14845.1 hypothetical protein CON16_23400 [Bacillus anthracis]
MLLDLWEYILKNGTMWGLIGALITLGINILITRKTKKENARVFLDTHAIERNVKNKLDNEGYENRAQLLLTDKYNELMGLLEDAHEDNLKEARIPYLVIENLSSNPCFGMKVNFNLKANSGKEEVEDFDIYTMKANGIVIIPLIHNGGYETNILEITYSTLESETMKYKAITTYKGKKEGTEKDDVEIKQTVYRKGLFGIYREIFSTTGSGMATTSKIKKVAES